MRDEIYMDSFSIEDWGRIIRALQSEARQLNTDSKIAYSTGAISYGALLLEEARILHDIADTIDLKLP